MLPAMEPARSAARAVPEALIDDTGAPVGAANRFTTMPPLVPAMPEVAGVTDEGVADIVRPVLGARTSEVMAVYRQNRPDITPYQLLVAIASEDRRLLSMQIAEQQSGTAPVYMYQNAWKSNAGNGLTGAGHGLDTPLAFDNADGRPTTGTDPNRYEMAALVAETWLAFAKTGDPNHAGLPTWKRFDPTGRQTMILDLPPHAEADPNGVERRAWDGIKVNLPWEGGRSPGPSARTDAYSTGGVSCGRRGATWWWPELWLPLNAMAAEATAHSMMTALMANGIAGGTFIDGSLRMR